MASQNVKGNVSKGWFHMIKDGIAVGWVQQWTLRLECGHEVTHTSDVFNGRSVDVLPPAWVNCRQCDREKASG
jgi:alcohol dehydrogenase YqhD (iron-dependent ADH family)